MQILVTGANGQLGSDVIRELELRHIPCKGVDMADFDICNFEQAKEYISGYAPEAVIHCAAYTAVDKAETEQELCMKVNAEGTENIAKVCRELDCKLMYISTDYVFGNSGTRVLQTDAPKIPLNIYGESKLAGENAVIENVKKYFIVRTSWVFGLHGNNFVKTMHRLATDGNHPEINVVCDQVGSPTYTGDLAKLICDMIVTEKYGVYHATNEGYCSWADFAREIMYLAGLSVKINDITTEEYNAPAARPKNSRLSKVSLDDNGFERLPSWQNALQRYLQSL
ncbi:MAG: dTDP-4-dehydrorhamnose reductase [Clostridiales bacterium]|nr:dTDP-4-dehydrorhamnose reductase [Clostridiales bacterium]